MSVFQAADTLITPYVRGRFEHLCCHPQEQIDDTTAHVHVTEATRKVAGAVKCIHLAKEF